jgi:hypothetical protein
VDDGVAAPSRTTCSRPCDWNTSQPVPAPRKGVADEASARTARGERRPDRVGADVHEVADRARRRAPLLIQKPARPTSRWCSAPSR